MGDNVSSEQSGIIYAEFDDILLVKAYAGTGKSFTLKKYCDRHSTKSFLYFVYNKSMKIDAKKSFSKIKATVGITTFHGIAYKFVGHLYEVRLEKEESLKSFDLLKYVTAEHIDDEELVNYAHALLKTIHDFTASMDSLSEYVRRHKKRTHLGGIHDYEMLSFVLDRLERVWNDIVRVNNTKIPFEHDFYLKLFQLSKAILDYDYILVDEAQDISPVMIDIILNQTHAKKIFVGDSYQSIYSFRGAVNSLEYIERNYSPSVHYLSKSFRCPPRVAWLANRIIKLAGAQKEFVGVATPSPVTKQVTYIARTNSGLFGFCAENLDKKIYFVGGVKSYNFTDLLDVLNLMSKKHEYIRSEFIKNFADFKEFNKYSRDMNDISMIGTIGIVLKYMKHNLYQLIKDIKETATTKMNTADIVVTTAHKSKGLEWAQVELIDDFPFGDEKKMERANTREELRLLYVAVTRAMNNVRLPEEILDYLEVFEEKPREAFIGEVRTTSSSPEYLQEDEDGQREEDEGDSDDDHGDHEKLFFCKACLDGNIFESSSKFYCDACDFQISHSKIISFFDTFKREFSRDVVSGVLKAITLKGGYDAKRLISKKGKQFDAKIILKKDERYGWGLSFSDDAPQKKKPVQKPRRRRSGNHIKPY